MTVARRAERRARHEHACNELSLLLAGASRAFSEIVRKRYRLQRLKSIDISLGGRPRGNPPVDARREGLAPPGLAPAMSRSAKHDHTVPGKRSRSPGPR